MSDHDSAGAAWRVAPSQYIEGRPATHALPQAPESRHVTMRDGCRLAVDTYLPQGAPGERLATIAIFTPYNRRFKRLDEAAEPSPNAAKYRDFFVPRGYALVVVDVRGTGASFGTREAFRSPKEREDYREIADWIVAQPWSNGVIGSTGISYLGAAACFLASTGHPAVKAIAPLFGVSDIYSEQLYPGGMMSRVWSRDYDELMLALDHDDREKTAKFAYFNDPRLSGPQPVDGDDDESLLRAALAEHRDNFRLHDMLPELAFRDEGPLHDPTLNTDACSPFRYLLAGTKPGLPVYSISGWYDGGGYANGAISRFLSLAGPQDRLLLGPWDHGARTNVSPWRPQVASEFPLLAEVLRFFDQHLLGLHTGLEDEAPVHYYSIHADQWHAAGAWPQLPAQRLYLAPGQVASASEPEHVSTASYQVRFDTTTGSDTRWERLGAANIENYYFDWTGRDAALLNFTSEPYAEDTELTGHAIAHLTVASSQRDAALFVYLAEVDADGRAHYITEGMLRALHRATAEAPPEYRTTWPYRRFTRRDAKLLEPGVPDRLVFALLPVSWTLKQGSRLRISIAGADADHFPQVPHGAPPRLELVLGGAQASFIELPLRKARGGSVPLSS
jgi:putative CocE/NonD family hydrolase